jgi:hypothetical protein
MKCHDCGGDYLIAYYPFLNLRLCLRCWVRRLYVKPLKRSDKTTR